MASPLQGLWNYIIEAGQTAADKMSGRHQQTYDAEHGAGAADAAIDAALNGHPLGLQEDVTYNPGNQTWYSDDVPLGSAGDGSGGGRSGGTRSATPVTYVDAPLAQLYGMNKAIAYQEALASTAHQREMKDYLAAGLNPVLAAGGGNGAAVFSGASDVVFGGRSGGSAKSVSVSDEETARFGRFVGDLVTLVSGGRTGMGNAAARIVTGVADSVKPD